ncbi:MAG: DUF721 domain-containing protein [Candidatus Schmidhempelia sp.]|nr:DUF721 domain-containing protein [Candidatus Schmidhempelia sp.]
MRKSAPQSLDRLFDEKNSLHKVQQRAVALAKLNQALKSLLPTPLQAQCRAANYRQHRLIVEVSSASWLTRLRYEQEKLLSTLRKTILPALSSIEFVINPTLNTQRHILHSHHTEDTSNHRIERQLSRASADMLLSLAENSPEKLKQTLLKLAQHANQTNKN